MEGEEEGEEEGEGGAIATGMSFKSKDCGPGEEREKGAEP